METKVTSRLYYRGVPTRPDVERLYSAFGIPKIGSYITYEEIGNIIDAHYQSEQHNRFLSVTDAWKTEILREHNIELIPKPGEAFKAATASDRVHKASKHLVRAYRQQKKAIISVSMPPHERALLTDQERMVADHNLEIGTKNMLQFQADRRKFNYQFKTENKQRVEEK